MQVNPASQKSTSALLIECNGVDIDWLLPIERLQRSDFNHITNITPLAGIPDNSLDVVLLSNCGLESELRKVKALYPKLRNGARVYINNVFIEFANVIKNCLSRKDTVKLFGTVLHPNVVASDEFKIAVTSILRQIFKELRNKFDINYSVRLDKNEHLQYLLLTKKKRLDIEQIKTTVFTEIYTAHVFDYNVYDLCRGLLQEGLIANCDEAMTFISDEYIQKVLYSLKAVDELLQGYLDTGISSVTELQELFNDKLDLTIANVESWGEYISLQAQRLLPNTDAESTETEYDTGSESTVESVDEDDTESTFESDEDVDAEEFPPVLKSGIVPINMIYGLQNVGGFSCFMDSLLVPMFYPDTGYIAEKLLHKQIASVDCQKDVQQQLTLLADHIRSGTPELKCYPIINNLKKCSEQLRIFLEDAPEEGGADDGEFLALFMEVFNLEPTTIKHVTFASNDNKNWVLVEDNTKNTAVVEIHLQGNAPFDLLKTFQRAEITNNQYTPYNEWDRFKDVPYQYIQRTASIQSSDYLILHVNRKRIEKGRLVKLTTPVEFSEYIVDTDRNKMLELYIVTIHRGGVVAGHYTSYFKQGFQWYKFDDTAEPTVVPTTWNKVHAAGRRNGSVFIYRN